MSPLSIVGITLLTVVLADVSHILKETPQQSADPQEINNAFTTKNAKDFWWMQDDSPLKASYEYFKKCADTGKCAISKEEFGSEDELGPVDIQKNIFLNGKFSSSSASSGSASISKSASGTADLSKNPFLQGGFAHAGDGASLCLGSNRACVKKANCVNGNVVDNAKTSSTNTCSEDETCCLLPAGKGSLAENVNQLVFTPGKSKIAGKDGLTAEQVQIVHSSQEGIRPQLNFIGEFDGSSTIKPTRDISAAASGTFFSSTPDYSNVNFGDDARFSNLDGLDYLPPLPGKPTTNEPTPSQSCPPGQFVNQFGRCEAVRESCPPGTRPTPSGGCEKLRVECPPGQSLGSYGGCVPIQTPPPTQQPTRPPLQCPPGQKPGPYGCVAIQTPAPPTRPPSPPTQPQCPAGQKPGPYGGCQPIQTPAPPTRPPPTRPQCPPGQRPDLYGGCVPLQTPAPPTRPSSTPYCPFGQVQGPNGQCQAESSVTERPYCPAGQREGPNGQCVPIPPICGPGQKQTPFGCEDVQTPRPTPTTEKPYCPSGQREGPNGECVPLIVCKPGQRETQFGGCEDIQTRPPPTPTRPPSPTCPAGQRPGPYGGCVPVQTPAPPTRPPQPQCPPGQRPGPYGGCVPVQTPAPPTRPPPPQCPPGQRPGPFGRCEPIQTPAPPTRPPPPQCPPGQKQGPYGGCVVIQTAPPPTRTPTTAEPYCSSGQREGPNGQCIPVEVKCPYGQQLGQFGECQPIPTSPPTRPPTQPPAPQCPPGQNQGPYGACIPIQRPPPTRPPQKYCPSGQRQGPNGECIQVQPSCPPGQKVGPYGGCVSIQTRPPPPPPTQPPTRPPQPSCGPGEREGPYGQCVPVRTAPPPTPTPGIYCNAGEREGPNGECVKIQSCPPGYTVGPLGQCTPPNPPTQPPIRPTPRPPSPTRPSCPEGLKPGPYGGCVPIQTQPPPTQPPRPPTPEQCPPGQKPGPYGGCVAISRPTPPPTQPPRACQPGYQLGVYGQCEPVQTAPPLTRPTPYCAAGQREGPNGECIAARVPTQPTCGPGQKLGPYGGCVDVVRPTSPPRPVCPPGSYPSASGGCQKPPPTQSPVISCPPGTVKTPSGRCETPPPPPRPITCPSGSYLGPSGNCVRPPPPTTERNYLPPKTPTATPGRPGYSYPTPTPSFNDGSSINDQYLIPDRTGEPGNNIPSFLRPSTERPSVQPSPYRPGGRQPSQPNYSGGNNTIPEDLIPVGCAAALKCVQEIYCTADGFISPVPVVLTKEQELLRAPTTVCRDIESGTLGKCCRDRDYQDAWPSANLVNGVDDGQYAEDDSIGQYKADYKRYSRAAKQNGRRSKRQTGECGVRKLNSNPKGQMPIDADFAEITWQAMILRDTNRSLLCGGAIIRKNAVLTAAHCVEGLDTSDILIKGGEWKLGIDEEPLPFQIVKVAAIMRHPDFKAGSSLQNDLAVLVLEENLRFTENIGQICLPEPNLIPTQNCIATGWGKRILQLHARNALMHRIDVSIMDVQQCQQVMQEHFAKSLSNYNTNTLCGFSSIDQCKVDYGSALACADQNGRYTLSGIYSWDTGCRQQGQIGGFVAPDVDWINIVLSTPLKQLKQLDRDYNAARSQSI